MPRASPAPLPPPPSVPVTTKPQHALTTEPVKRTPTHVCVPVAIPCKAGAQPAAVPHVGGMHIEKQQQELSDFIEKLSLF